MKFYKGITLILVLLICSCSTSVTPTTTISAKPTFTLTPFPSPTNTETPSPTPDPFILAEYISYDINKDIWIRVQGTIENDKPKFYVIPGRENQTIGIHFHHLLPAGSWIKETKIIGRNGIIGQPDWTSDMGGWMGKLPSTQDYLITTTLDKPKKTDFILEILNIPQRQETGKFDYTDKRNGFELTYSQDDFTPSFNKDIRDVFSVSLDTNKYFGGTTLQSVDLVISVFAECYEPYDPQFAEKETFNNVSFLKFVTGDATASTGFELLIFQSNHNQSCYQIFVRSSFLRSNKFPGSTEKDYSKSLLYTKIYRLLNTFKFIQ